MENGCYFGGSSVTAEILNVHSIRLNVFYVQVVVSEAEKQDVLHTFHNDVTSGGHYGQNLQQW